MEEIKEWSSGDKNVLDSWFRLLWCTANYHCSSSFVVAFHWRTVASVAWVAEDTTQWASPSIRLAAGQLGLRHIKNLSSHKLCINFSFSQRVMCLDLSFNYTVRGNCWVRGKWSCMDVLVPLLNIMQFSIVSEHQNIVLFRWISREVLVCVWSLWRFED